MGSVGIFPCLLGGLDVVASVFHYNTWSLMIY